MERVSRRFFGNANDFTGIAIVDLNDLESDHESEPCTSKNLSPRIPRDERLCK
ncbi:MAG TPA: hypothetical protein VH170_09065 [Chthoniobacterales bacterium]|nr:hypothetical protein [Chthoniobacterales bacterium]